jgi:hypothetical protein
MNFVEELRLAMVREDLQFMGKHAQTGESPIVVSIAKAVTAAQIHPDIEARIVCRDVMEAVAVVELLARMSRGMTGWFVNSERRTLEFTNGSGVRVDVEGAKKS